MYSFKKILISLLIVSFSTNSFSARIKDIASVQGVRSNQLVGYGLVVGLPGTGEKSTHRGRLYRE